MKKLYSIILLFSCAVISYANPSSEKETRKTTSFKTTILKNQKKSEMTSSLRYTENPDINYYSQLEELVEYYQDGELRNKFTYSFDQEKRQLTEEAYNNDRNNFEHRRVFTYDSNNRIASEMYWNYDDEKEIFIESNYSQFEYDNAGRIILGENRYFDVVMNKWYNTRKETIKYDTNGNITEWADYGWDDETNKWVGDEKNVMHYESDGIIVGAEYYEWEEDINDWFLWGKVVAKKTEINDNLYMYEETEWDEDSEKWSLVIKGTMTYNEKKQLIKDEYSEINSETNEILEQGYTEYAYDSNGNIILEENKYWYDDQTRGEKEIYEYDSKNNLLYEEYLSIDRNNGDWVGNYKRTHKVGNDGRPLSYQQYYTDDETGEYVLSFYGEYKYNASSIGNATNEKSDAYIYSGVLFVDSDTSEVITIYSATGQLLHTEQKQAGKYTYELSHLPQGLVIVKGSTGWTLKAICK